MKEKQVLHGFLITRVRPLPEIEATMYEMVYEKNGAKLLYLDRADSNKTFAIAFKTIPDDDTGVFHIIEHSVLCGSQKYPIKDPFVELLKGSLQTFLNAMTYPDKTMYPVCSRNDRDFLNLVDVYMDAVLHPQILQTPEIFYQEGWHYEWNNADDLPTYKGVVFNEMKGSYSSVDRLMGEKMMALMYPDTCYGKASGGDPVHIPELTYEKFLACHAKYYHPSNARIFLDGTMDLPSVLQKLDEFLSPYERLDLCADIPLQAPVGDVHAECEYELSPGEDGHNKFRLGRGYMGFPFDAQKESLAVSLLSSVLCGSNEAPLKLALLSRGLCQDVSLSYEDGIQQNMVQIDVQNIEEDAAETICEVIDEVFRHAAEGGLDTSRMTAALNSMEFRLRERDFGRYPRGLVYGMTTMDTWLYDGDPAQNLCYDDTLAFLRAHLSDGYFEDLIRRLFLDNPHKVTLLMKPSKTLAQRRLDDERRRLSQAKAAFTPEQAQEIFALNRRLVAWQQTPDTPEALSTLPTLSLSDIAPTPEKHATEVCEVGGVTVLKHPLPTAGILYTALYFNAADAAEDDLPYLSLLSALFTHTATEDRDALAVQDLVKTYLGYLSMDTVPVSVGTDTSRAKLFVCVSAGVLDKNKEHLCDILRELLYRCRLDNKEQICNILRQIKMEQEAYLLSAGHQVGVRRTTAALSVAGAATEKSKGYDFYRWVKDTEEHFDERADALMEKLTALMKQCITRDRLTLSVTGPCDDAFLHRILDIFDTDGVACPAYMSLRALPVMKEGICIPSQISYAVRSAYLGGYTGTMAVAEGLLSYEYLWNRIRVQGGAYGAGQAVRKNGCTFQYTYRDPDAKNSLSVFAAVPAYLRDFAAGGEPIEKFIIGAVGSSEPLLSPRAEADAADGEYLSEVGYEDACRVRRQMLDTTPADLAALADAMERAFADSPVCVVGGKDKLDLCRGELTDIHDM